MENSSVPGIPVERLKPPPLTGKAKAQILELCRQAAKERDRGKFQALVLEMNRVFGDCEEQQRNLEAKSKLEQI